MIRQHGLAAWPRVRSAPPPRPAGGRFARPGPHPDPHDGSVAAATLVRDAGPEPLGLTVTKAPRFST